jgi:hypothetical protein
LYDAPVSEPHIRKVRPDELEDVWLFVASRLFGRPELYLPSGPILY